METREGDAVEKRLSRVEKWLSRCRAACRVSAWHSALMEIECMEAETKGVREDLWVLARNEAEGRKARSPLSAAWVCTRVVTLAAALIMALVLPLSVEQDTPGAAVRTDTIALLTSTESEILNALRESLSNENAGRLVLTIERPAEPENLQRGAAAALDRDEPSRPPARIAAVRAPEKPATPEMAPSSKNPSTREPSVEEVISLIQVGQRALRVSEPAVRIMP